jgi:hypothetical protein
MSVEIGSNAELQALEQRHDDALVIYLGSLGALSTAIPSYSLVRRLVYPRNWTCPKIDVLEGYCALVIDLNYLRNDLLLHIVSPAAANAYGPH